MNEEMPKLKQTREQQKEILELELHSVFRKEWKTDNGIPELNEAVVVFEDFDKARLLLGGCQIDADKRELILEKINRLDELSK